MLPFHDPAGTASSEVIGLAESRFEALPNGRPSSVEDLLALLILSTQTEADEDPNPRVVAAKVQMDKLGFGSKLTLSPEDQLGLYQLALWRLEQRESLGIRRLLLSRGHEPRAVVRALWQRCVGLWKKVERNRAELAKRCAALEAELEPLLPSGLALLPHQLEGVLRARDSGFRHIFGDDMGLGKTVEILACALLMGNDAFPMLVSCPLSMVYKWKVEAAKWLAKVNPELVTLDRKVHVPTLFAEMGDRPFMLVGSWQAPAYHQQLLQTRHLGLVVGDESHYISNWEAGRTQGFIRSRRRARAVLLATGTLMENGRHREAYSQLKAMNPDCLQHLRQPNEAGELPKGDRYPYLYRYCGPTKVFVGKRDKEGNPVPVTQFDGRSNEVEFGCLLNRHVTRRTKVEVFGPEELPPKSRYVIPVPISDAQRMGFARTRDQIAAKVRAKAKEVEDHLVAHSVRPAVIEQKVKKVTQSEAVRLISALRLQIGREKAKWSKVRINELLAEGHRPVVFSWHNEVAELAAEAYAKKGVSVLLGTGSSTGRAREKIVAAAEAGEHDVVVLTSAYREGITLTAYDRLMMLERWWKPGSEQQAEDRIHRYGQQLPVAIEYLIIPGTYDEAIGELQVWKERGQVQSQGSAEERVYQWLMAA
jgi:hypothetical protein